MADPVIEVENLGKKYIIDHQSQTNSRYVALRDVLTDRIRSVGRRFQSGAPDPRARTSRKEEFWALKQVSFQVQQGEVVGIIGRNGAGKSTLLKLLSRITQPTTGTIHLRGRVASLLEVGTGFHPELTGRENIFLNGAILGMSRAEIKSKFDEIVAFAEVDRFLDTPVKRYSSGMYVRLAFAVAAHLEPEILIVDEVLAVGDAAFQKKCLGKMGDVGKEGRTVLFVSHNMAAVRNLCTSALTLQQGCLIKDQNVETAIRNYLLTGVSLDAHVVWDQENAPQSSEIRFLEAYVLNQEGHQTSMLDCREGFSIVVRYLLLESIANLRIGFFMQNWEGVPICGSNDPMAWHDLTRSKGEYVSRCDFPGYLLNRGRYSIYFGADIPPSSKPLVTTGYCLDFTVEDVEGHGSVREKLPGVLRPKLIWHVNRLSFDSEELNVFP
jgi:lipopolysaccharide transport system ATP-binding protein